MNKVCRYCIHWEGLIMDSVDRELIVDCHRDADYTCPSWKGYIYEEEWPSNERIDRIGRDGNDGLHYGEKVE